MRVRIECADGNGGVFSMGAVPRVGESLTFVEGGRWGLAGIEYGDCLLEGTYVVRDVQWLFGGEMSEFMEAVVYVEEAFGADFREKSSGKFGGEG